jgi:NAD(P)-dependent dehydrogenase (short-subunit alcohol dehydrogenase family)
MSEENNNNNNNNNSSQEKILDHHPHDDNVIRTFHGSVCIITGGASGIGKALAEELSDQGSRAIVLLDRDMDSLEKVADALQTWTETKVYEVDVRSYEDILRAIKETKETFGRIDYMFNNAGISIDGTIDDIGVDDFNYILDVNLRGAANGIHAAYPIMREQGFGHLVQTSSIAGLIPFGEGVTAYGASKYAVVGLSLNLRVEAARHGVRVSALCPGIVDTPILKGGGKYGKSQDGVPQDVIDDLSKKLHKMDPKTFAKNALKQVSKNKPIITLGRTNKFMLWIHRHFPSVGLWISSKRNSQRVEAIEKFKAEQTKQNDESQENTKEEAPETAKETVDGPKKEEGEEEREEVDGDFEKKETSEV